MTNQELLTAWYADEEIKTVEMGGLGDGYELAIHETAMAMLSYMETNSYDFETDAKDVEKWKAYKDKMFEDPLVKTAMDDKGGITGAMLGAALNISAVYASNGYESGIATMEEDRIITISRK